MEALEKQHDPLMGFYFSCPHCQRKYISAECVQEHWTTCQVQSSSSFMIPHIKSYSSLNPQAFDVNFASGGFPIQHEIIKKEPEDYIEDDNTDWQDETEDSTLNNPEDIQKGLYPAGTKKLQPRLTRRKTKVHLDSDETEEDSALIYPSEDVPNLQQAARYLSNIRRDTLKNPHSTCTEDRYSCRYCPRTFPYPSTVLLHEESHTREPKVLLNSDDTGEDSAWTNLSEDASNLQQAARSLSKIRRDTLKNPHSTCTEDRYSCRHCPRTFPYPSFVLLHEESHTREPKYSCRSCGQAFVQPQSLRKHMKSHEPDPGFPCRYPGCPETFQSALRRWTHHKTHPWGRWNEHKRWPRQLRKNQKSNTAPAAITTAQLSSAHKYIKNSPMTDQTDKSKNARKGNSRNSMKSHDPAQTISCLFPGCPKTFKSRFTRCIHHKTHPKGRWNRSGRRPGWRLRQNQKTSLMPPKLTPVKENLTDNESMDTSSMPDLSIEGPMTHPETKPEVNTIQQSAVNDATTNLVPKGPNNPPTTSRRGRPAKPGDEIEVMTAWGRKFKCDLCDKMYPHRTLARYHRFSHFNEPQFSCYMTGCSEMFFSGVQRVNHVKSVHGVIFRKRKPFIGTRPIAVNITGPSKVIAKAIIPNVNTARQPSQSPQKIQPNGNPNCDRNTARVSQTGGLNPGKTVLFPCGLCDGSFDNLDILKYHMLKIHEGESQAAELGKIGTPAENESMETSSIPDLSIEGRKTDSETKSTNNLEFKNVRQSAVNNATTNQESRGCNNPLTTRRRGRPAQPGDEIEIMTALGRKFKCDLCDKMFLSRMVARDHRLSHYERPQISCYVTGCSKMFFSRSQRVNHLKSAHHVIFRKGRPFFGSNRLALKTTGPSKSVAKEINPNVKTARLPSQSPPKIQLNGSPKSDQNQNIPRGAERGLLGPGETLFFTCGICGSSFENLHALKCHMLKTHAGPEESQAEEIRTPVDSSFQGVQAACKGDRIPVEVKPNKAISNLPKKTLNAGIKQKGPLLRYPIVKVGGKKYLYCGFPGCDAVFNDRIARYKHQKKYHDDAPRTMFTYLPEQLSQKTANETSSETPKGNSADEKKKTADSDSLPDFPAVQVNGKKYYWCEFPGCAIVTTSPEARYLHQKKHRVSSEQSKIDQKSVRPDPKMRKFFQKVTRPKIPERNEDESLGHTLPPNKLEISEFSMQNDEEMPAQSSMQDDAGMPAQAPTQFLAGVLDQHSKADEQEMSSDLPNQSMDALQFYFPDDNDYPLEHLSLFNEDFNAENIAHTDSGLGSELSSVSSSALRNISNPTSWKTEVLQRLPVVKERKSRGRPSLYPEIQIGSRKLFCCGVPGCTGVFKSRRVRDQHHKNHRLGKKVNSRLKLTEDGMVLDSSGGCYLPE